MSRGGLGRRLRLPRWNLGDCAVGGEVEERGGDVDPGDPVGERVVRLVDQPDVPVPVDALHEPQLPERVVTIEHLLEQPLRQRDELASAARRRERGEADVTGDVEVGVVDPDGAPEPERDVQHPPAEPRDQ